MNGYREYGQFGTFGPVDNRSLPERVKSRVAELRLSVIRDKLELEQLERMLAAIEPMNVTSAPSSSAISEQRR